MSSIVVKDHSTSTPSNPSQSTMDGGGDRPLLKSGLSTPGPDFPGAYPRGATNEQGAGRQSLDSVKKFIPSQDTVKTAVLNAGETAKQYLPNVLTSYFPPSASESHTATDPLDSASKKGEADQARTSGPQVGIHRHAEPEYLEKATDGSTSKSSFSNPSDKNTFSSPSSNTYRRGSATISNLSTQAQYGSETSFSSQLPPISNTITENHHQGTASADTLRDNRKDSTEGKDNTSDTHTAAEHKPTDRQTVHTQGRTHPLAGPGAKWNGIPLEEEYQKALDDHPDRQLSLGTATKHHQASVDEASHKDKPTNKMQNGTINDDTVRSPRSEFSNALQHDSTTADAGHSPAVTAGRDGAAVKGAVDTAHTNEPSNGGSSPRRSKFMHKIKGEVKILSGKLSHNEEKVIEGKRLLGKDV